VAGIVEGNSKDSGCLIVVTGFYGRFSDQWVLDIACTFHKSPKRNWFTIYESVDGGSVLMGNDVACKIVSMGTIRIRMHNGSHSS